MLAIICYSLRLKLIGVKADISVIIIRLDISVLKSINMRRGKYITINCPHMIIQQTIYLKEFYIYVKRQVYVIRINIILKNIRLKLIFFSFMQYIKKI